MAKAFIRHVPGHPHDTGVSDTSGTTKVLHFQSTTPLVGQAHSMKHIRTVLVQDETHLALLSQVAKWIADRDARG